MSGKMKLYLVHGEMITIAQAAERAFVSVAAIRARLTDSGGDMEAVMDYSARKNSGGGKK